MTMMNHGRGETMGDARGVAARTLTLTPSRVKRRLLASALALAFAGCIEPEAPSNVSDEALDAHSRMHTRSSELWGSNGDKYKARCGSGTYVHGIDVSKWQGTINWSMVASAGIDYAFIRSSYGQTGVDSQFDANWAGARAAGVLRGAYHYFNPAYPGDTQATSMLAQFADANDLGELPIVIDVEERDGAPVPAIYASRVAAFVDTIEAATGRRPMIYSGGSFWDTYLATDEFADLPIWVAHYFNDRSTAHCPNTPNAWTAWTFWQHSEMGSVAGISGGVDLDVFDGTYDDLLALTFHRAKPVAQSFPIASRGTLRVELGTCVDATITLENTGGVAWDSNVELALSSPRDGAIPGITSPSWLSPTRLDAVVGQVTRGQSYEFSFEVCGNALGTHDARFNLVHEGVAWFSDPGQGGPTDTYIQALVEVVPVGSMPDPGNDAGVPALDAGVGLDAGTSLGGDGGVCVGEPCETPRRRQGGCSVASFGAPAPVAPCLAAVFVLTGIALVRRARRR